MELPFALPNLQAALKSKRANSKQRSKRRFRPRPSSKLAPTSLTPQQMLQRSSLSPKHPVGNPAHVRLSLNDGASILSQEHTPGVVLALLTINAFNPRDLNLRWSTVVPWRDMFQVRHTLRGQNTIFLANGHRAAFLDRATGRVYRELSLDTSNGSWHRIKSDGDRVFLLYNNPPRLSAISSQ